MPSPAPAVTPHSVEATTAQVVEVATGDDGSKPELDTLQTAAPLAVEADKADAAAASAETVHAASVDEGSDDAMAAVAAEVKMDDEEAETVAAEADEIARQQAAEAEPVASCSGQQFAPFVDNFAQPTQQQAAQAALPNVPAAEAVEQQRTMCNECEGGPATISCDDCNGLAFCDECWKDCHKKAMKAKHKTTSLSKHDGTAAAGLAQATEEGTEQPTIAVEPAPQHPQPQVVTIEPVKATQEQLALAEDEVASATEDSHAEAEMPPALEHPAAADGPSAAETLVPEKPADNVDDEQGAQDENKDEVLEDAQAGGSIKTKKKKKKKGKKKAQLCEV